MGFLLLLVAVITIGLAGCGEGVPPIDTNGAEVALSELASITGVPDKNQIAMLDDCPIVDHDLLLKRTLRDVGDPLLDEAFIADPIAFISTPTGESDGDVFLLCGHLAQPGTIGAAIVVGDAPGDSEDENMLSEKELNAKRDATAAVHAARFGDPPEFVTIDRRINTRGGVMYHVCISVPATPKNNSCEAVWFRGNLSVSTVLTGSDALEVDLGEIDESMRRMLQLIVDGLTADIAVSPRASLSETSGLFGLSMLRSR